MSNRIIDVADWVDPAAWNEAPNAIRDRWLKETAEDVQATMRRQIIAGVGRDGKKLSRLLNPRREDGSRDRPLTPHDETSRAVRLLKVVWVAGRLSFTVHWSHFTRILEYHAAGIRSRIGKIVRDVTGLAGSYRRRAKSRAKALWLRLWPFKPSDRPGVGPYRGRLPADILDAPPSRRYRLF